MKKITAIVPAYNEGDRIQGVLQELSQHPHINEIVVVDDNSSDDTHAKAMQFPKAHVIRHESHKGKTHALHSGLKHATSDHVFFVDADLIGLSQETISAMTRPVIQGETDATISLRGNAPKLWRALGIDYISGERVFHRGILEGREQEMLALPKFGFEVFFNKLLLDNKLRLKIVPWDTVASPYKIHKYGIIEGVKGDLRMMRDIFKVVSPFTALAQIIKMRSASKRT